MQTTEADFPDPTTPGLTTPDLTLALIVRDDISEFLPLLGSWEVVRYTSRIPYPYSQADGEAYVARVADAWRRNGSLECALRDRKDGTFVGIAALTIDDDPAEAEIGYWIGLPFWGRGFATQASQALIRHGFTAMGLDRIVSTVVRENAASSHVLEKVGLNRTGEDETFFPARDKHYPVYRFELTREKWMKDNG
ncbi:GNAT family N-acetyltransferase [Rhodospirillaceae bacterium KN72]|uniref:GNAT family N-acetyltransferase n=1 Tax=Pacificispira spongiicola TaxID=2729598 RepID=A0A7Y0E2I0_9PROT|nr:GNAT family N-acetyltransferase [Pacificispira spongiicola]NMM45271.1 GNAT family N-acetyltransferase [Pacificispira spongiicola]